MRKSILWFVFLTLLTIQSAFAQSFYVKGKVISQEDNEPLIGVSILQEGSTNGVVTDVDGNYSLEIKGTARATLLFSYIGMQSQKHEVSAKTGTLNVRLAPDAALIDEVVVVAQKGDDCRLCINRKIGKNGKCTGSRVRPGIAGTDAGFVSYLQFRRAQ